MANRLPIPRIERRSRDSLLYDAEDGCFPRIVGRVRQMAREECSILGVPCWYWDAGEAVYPSREEAEAAMVIEWFGEDKAVRVIDRRKTR